MPGSQRDSTRDVGFFATEIRRGAMAGAQITSSFDLSPQSDVRFIRRCSFAKENDKDVVDYQASEK